MPRPKVKPQDRQRSVRACDTCKASKKRCDANQPCRLCLKKGTQDSCTYTPTARDRRTRYSRSDTSYTTRRSVTAVDGTEDLSTNLASILTGTSAQRPRPQFGEPTRAAEDDADSETENIPESRDSVEGSTQKPVMLSSSSGDKVFVGNTAALSFLRFLQRTLKHYVGPSGFTDRQHSHSLFELASSEADGDIFYDDLDENEKKTLVRCFLDASSGFLDLYTQDELKHLIISSKPEQDVSPAAPTQRTDRISLASLYLMVAIGAQVKGSSKDDILRASKYFTQGRKMAFEKMLEDPTISLVRVFILMAFYMFGACRRNSAFMYLGVAAKSADILGLHAAAHHRNMSKAERDSRIRVAKSIRVFDIICSSILGRRSSAPSLRSVDVSSGDIDQESTISCHRALALRATYESCSILEIVVGKFVDDGSLNTLSAEHYLQLLREWSQILPAPLRQRPRKGDISRHDDPKHREAMIANIHVAGTYYFGIILITRQFLIQHIMPQLRGNESRQKETRHPSDDITDAESKTVPELSRACIEAATYMAQMCCEAVDARVLLGNMCIIKAWVFAAGLVLGFSLLADDTSDGDTREAFRGSQHVLSKLSRLSAQAAQYHKILCTFSDAIDIYRRQMRRERNESRIPFVEQILSYDNSSSVSAREKGDGVFDQYIPNYGMDTDTRQNRRVNSQVGDTATPQLPTPDFQVDDMAAGGAGFWNGSDTLSSMSMSEFLPENWPPPADNELMLRLLWDGYTMSFDDPTLHAEGT